MGGGHSSDITHLLEFHLIPMALAAGFVYGAIYLIVRLATRPGKSGGREPRNLSGLNRQQRQHEHAMQRQAAGALTALRRCKRLPQISM